MFGVVYGVVFFLAVCNVCRCEDAPSFPNTFYANYTYQLVVNNRTAHGKGYMASDGTSRRITSTTIDIAQTGETIGTGLLQRFDMTPHIDYAYLIFANGTMDCKPVKPNQTELHEYWSWLPLSNHTGDENINGHTYDMWSIKEKEFGLAAGTKGKVNSVPALFISSFNQTTRYFFYTDFETGNPKPDVYDIPQACTTPEISLYDVSPYGLVKTVIGLVFH